MRQEEVPVLIVGGSLVGLSTSLFLAHQGVAHLVVERHPGTSIHPRAAFVTQRTVELFRAVGIEDEVLAAARREFVQNGAIVAVDSLSGRELQWFFRNINEGVEKLSPSPRIFVTQIGLEPVLRKHATRLGAQLLYSTEVVSLDPGEQNVTAVLRDRASGQERVVHARYVVAADGAHSAVRRQLGIAMTGHGAFSDSITIYFRADVRHLLGERNLSVVYVVNPRLQGFFRFSFDAQSGFLVVNSAVDDAGQRTTTVGATAGEADCVRYVREALGAPDLAVQIEDVQRWSAAADWAQRLRSGRVMLAGDAAHVMPPTGGYGGNTGVQDAHNLAWKLAFVLDGRAGEALLDTYEQERLPAARLAVEQAYTRYVTRLDPALGTEGLEPVIDDAVVDLGYRYLSGSITADAADTGDGWEDPHAPTGRPGFRAPHATVIRYGVALSTLDLVKRDFVLFAGNEGGAWAHAAVEAAKRLGVGIDVFRIGEDLHDPNGAMAGVYGLAPAGAVLVRPDGFVAWRSGNADSDSDPVAHALARALCRTLT
ncbi:FAD-dependent oxidoreductase [Rhizocola hellebori]|uniref:FAD-dependent oxidoreductase n=1 Tax=Rhizocola hellebori TaxID=1392758 RepID=A0A8J3Q5S9_9ACTN|nr:FAD-dependent monooxygenase [Rhizocola hellebori]GIH03788.1 FAD-dependent oxidoreductase [Rhizocola hellebori]